MMKTPLISALLLAATLAHANPLTEALSAYDEGDLKAAARGFTASASQGNALGQFNLAMMHLRKELPDARDATAWRLLRKAADQQLALAENALGEMIEQGRRGKPEPKAACGWFERAAEHGNPDGALATADALVLEDYNKGVLVPALITAAVAAARAMRRGGVVNFFGGCATGTEVHLDTQLLHYSEITCKASFHHTPELIRKIGRVSKLLAVVSR
mgnify:CR=1 FL=1